MTTLPSTIRVGKSAAGFAGPEKFFVKMLKESGELDKRPNLYGSDAGHCPRKNFFYASLEDQVSSFGATGQIYMGMGNGAEDALANALERNGRLFFQNLYLPPMDPVVRGKIDLVYIDEDDDIAIGELKTCGALPTEPKPTHLSQLATYAAVGGYNKTNLIYISRNVADYSTGAPRLMIKVFPITFSFDDHVETLAKVVFSKNGIDQGFAPPIPTFFRKSVECQFCPFTEYCWGDEEHDFYELEPGEITEEWLKAKEAAEKLTVERETRYVASLRHLFRNIGDRKLQQRLVTEIEKYETF